MFAGVAIFEFFIGNKSVILPDRLAIPAPITGEGPAGQRFARVPFALAEMIESALSKFVFQTPDEFTGKLAFFWADRGEIPLGAVHIVDRNESWLSTHGET